MSGKIFLFHSRRKYSTKRLKILNVNVYKRVQHCDN